MLSPAQPSIDVQLPTPRNRNQPNPSALPSAAAEPAASPTAPIAMGLMRDSLGPGKAAPSSNSVDPFGRMLPGVDLVQIIEDDSASRPFSPAIAASPFMAMSPSMSLAAMSPMLSHAALSPSMGSSPSLQQTPSRSGAALAARAIMTRRQSRVTLDTDAVAEAEVLDDDALHALKRAVTAKQSALAGLRKEAAAVGVDAAQIKGAMQSMRRGTLAVVTSPPPSPRTAAKTAETIPPPLEVPASPLKPELPVETLSTQESPLATERLPAAPRPPPSSRRRASVQSDREALTARTAAAYFDPLSRGEQAGELQQLLAALQQAAGEQPAEAAAMAAQIADLTRSAEGLVRAISGERVLHESTVRFLENRFRQERREAEVQLERAQARTDAAERLLQAAAVERAAALEAAQAARDGTQHDVTTVETTEETTDEGVTVKHVAVQNKLGKSVVETAFAVLSRVAEKEQLITALITQMESLVFQIDDHNGLLEHELACGACDAICQDYFILWTCGHIFCSDCIEGSQSEQGDVVCPGCGTVTYDAPVVNLNVNWMAARVAFKRASSQSVVAALTAFRATVAAIDGGFLEETMAYHKGALVGIEYQPQPALVVPADASVELPAERRSPLRLRSRRKKRLSLSRTL
jgi:hypothetical protein